jgi:transcriptional regulator with XRE-family HTH domain
MSEGNSFGDMLHTARRQMGWTQEEVAEKLGVKRVTVNRWEQGIQRPSAKWLEKLVTIYGFNLNLVQINDH